jgi:hypothetical protein
MYSCRERAAWRVLLVEFFAGERTMFRSPVLDKWRAEIRQEAILDVLKDRFGTVPHDVTKHLRDIMADKKLRLLLLQAAKCADLKAFRDALL